MQPGKKIAPHETFEVHELLTFKNIAATKASVMAGFVKDEELKNMMQNDFILSQEHIRELKELLQASELLDQETSRPLCH